MKIIPLALSKGGNFHKHLVAVPFQFLKALVLFVKYIKTKSSY